MRKVLLMLAMMMTMVSCGERKDLLEALNTYIDQLHGVGAYTGEIVKKKSEQKGYMVLSYTDTNGEVIYLAVRYDNWEKGTVIDSDWINAAFAASELDEGLVDNGDGTYTGNDGRIYEASTASAKDLEKIGAIEEGMQVAALADVFATEYGLSEVRSQEVAKSVSAFKKIAQTRTMTDADGEFFTQNVLGLSMDEVSAALRGETNTESLIDRAAEVNEISPEHMSEIVRMMTK